MISHFKIIVDGVKVPAGRRSTATPKAATASFGFYIVSDGTGRPYKVPRAPACASASRRRDAAKSIVNKPVAAIVPTFDTMNMIGGELTR